MSPQIFGFDFGVSFAPNVTANIAGNQCSSAGSASASFPLTVPSGCVALQSSAAAVDEFRPKNMVELMTRYQGVFGPVGLYAVGGYVASGHVQGAGAGTPGFGPATNGFSVGDGGLAVTIAGFTVGGHIIGGQMNGQVALQPKGGVHAIAWIAGVQYAIGPITVGASWYNYQSQGSAGSVSGPGGGSLLGISQRYDEGLDIGGTLSIAPGLVAYAGYSYGQKHQGSFNFITNQTTGAAAGFNNTMNSNIFTIGTRVSW
jgi:predicted porin